MKRVNTWAEGAMCQSPSRIRRVRREGSGGNGDWLHTTDFILIPIFSYM